MHAAQMLYEVWRSYLRGNDRANLLNDNLLAPQSTAEGDFIAFFAVGERKFQKW